MSTGDLRDRLNRRLGSLGRNALIVAAYRHAEAYADFEVDAALAHADADFVSAVLDVIVPVVGEELARVDATSTDYAAGDPHRP